MTTLIPKVDLKNGGSTPAGAINRPINAKLQEIVSVKDFGALGDGSTDDTTAFQNAVDSGAGAVYVPQSTSYYKVGDFNVPDGVKVFGEGQLRYTGVSSYDENLNIDIPNTYVPMRTIFVHDAYSYAALLGIKNLGFNTIIHYLQLTNGGTYDDVLYNCKAVGLQLIPSVQIFANYQSAVPTEISTTVDDPTIYGLYLFDEPIDNSISKTTQNNVVTLYRTVTDKPFCISQAGQYSWEGCSTVLSSNFDIIFNNSYYNPSFSGGFVYNGSLNQDQNNKARALISIAQQADACPITKIVPCLGLFEDSVFSSLSKSINFSKDFARLSNNGDVCVFTYDASTQSGSSVTEDLSNNASLRTAWGICSEQAINEYKVTYKSYIFYNGQKMGDLLELYNKDYTNADVYPWSVTDVGSAVNTRKQDFGMTGLAIANTGGIFAAKPASRGCVVAWVNHQTVWPAQTLDISMLSTTADFYANASSPAVDTNTLSSTQTVSQSNQYGAISLPEEGLGFGLSVIPSASETNPFKMLEGTIINSNWTTVTF